jgi:hypothetical protein
MPSLGDFDPWGFPKGVKVWIWDDVLEEDIVVETGVALRSDFDAARLRQPARVSKNANQGQRLLTLAEIYVGDSVRVLSKQMDRLGEGRFFGGMSRRSKPKSDPFRYFNSSPEVIRLVVMIYVRFPLSLGFVVKLTAGIHAGNRVR